MAEHVNGWWIWASTEGGQVVSWNAQRLRGRSKWPAYDYVCAGSRSELLEAIGRGWPS